MCVDLLLGAKLSLLHPKIGVLRRISASEGSLLSRFFRLMYSNKHDNLSRKDDSKVNAIRTRDANITTSPPDIASCSK